MIEDDLPDYPCRCFREYYIWECRFQDAETDEELEAAEQIPLVWNESELHVDPRYQSQRAWDIACEIFDSAARTGLKKLSLGQEMDRADYKALNTLPESIGQLKDLEELVLYGSNLSSIPREISGCERLKNFVPYTSYRLHWFPHEIRQCADLVDSVVSTRALYGNYKFRPPFPDLTKTKWVWPSGEAACSICGEITEQLDQYWVSQHIATDVLPLLVSVCSRECLSKTGAFPKDYVQGPHKGGLGLEQPRMED